MSKSVEPPNISAIGDILNDANRPLAERYRALSKLRDIGGHQAVDCIATCFNDESVLLKHELAFSLGQIQDEYAIPTLIRILKDVAEEPIVRHEAGEALGAIGTADVLDLLMEYSSDPVPEVAETCQLAAARISWLHGEGKETGKLPPSPYPTVDPAPPSVGQSVDALKATLVDDDADLFQRYRAMFALRNLSSPEAALALAEGLRCPRSAVFRHEIAYVLGQMEQSAVVPQLTASLNDPSEPSIVRHECADAIRSIAADGCEASLRRHVCDSTRIVSDSCVLALDSLEFELKQQPEGATGLATS